MKTVRYPKNWGTTTLVLLLPKLQVHRIMVAPQSECSVHHHKFKANRFYVESGELIVRVFTWSVSCGSGSDPTTGLINANPDVCNMEHSDHLVRTGEIFDVMPGVTHQFIQPKGDAPDVIAYEMYWCPDGSDVRDDDIVRLREGRGSMVWAEGTNVVK